MSADDDNAVWGTLLPISSSRKLELHGRRFTLGRSPQCNWTCNDQKMSEFHCYIEKGTAPRPALLMDQSSNGTFVNSRRLQPGKGVHLRDGDVISLADKGNRLFMFRSRSALSSASPPPVAAQLPRADTATPTAKANDPPPAAPSTRRRSALPPTVIPTDPDVVAELKQLQVELDWVLREEVPDVFMQLGIIIKDCWKKFQGAPSASLTSELIPIHTPPPHTVSGALSLDGCLLVSGELTLRFNPKTSRFPSCKVNIATPIVIQQFQDCGNYLHLALTDINNSSLQQGLFHTREQVRHVTERVILFLRKAKEQLTVSSVTLPSRVYESSLLWQPALPRTVIFDTHVSYGQLQVLLYAMTETHYSRVDGMNSGRSSDGVNGTSKEKHSKKSGGSGGSGSGGGSGGGGMQAVAAHPTMASATRSALLGQTCESAGRLLQVTDIIELPLALPQLKRVLAHIKMAHELCQSLYDRVSLLPS